MPPCSAGPVVPRFLEEGVSESLAKELIDKALVYINPALGEEVSQMRGVGLGLGATEIPCGRGMKC